MADYLIDSITPGASELVFTTHITHQELFFVHVDSRAKILDDIMDKLATRYMNLGPADKLLVTKRVGTLCAAKFTDDDNWYRGKITGIHGNGLIEVQFVDYGNTDYVGEDRLKALDPDLIQYPIQCYRCALADVSCAQGFWTPELMVQFEDKVLDKCCRAVFRSKRNLDEVYLVEMYGEDGNYINGMFGAQDPNLHGPNGGPIKEPNQDGGFKEMIWDVGTKIIGTIVYSSSPSQFWCQDTAYVNNILILSETLSRLHMTQDIKPLAKVSPGAVCAAKFSQDEAWYRGIVQSVSANSAKIFFVDYGNSESVSLEFVCNLKPEMMELPALAVKCCLFNMPLKSTDNNPDVQNLFDTLVSDKELEVKVVNKQGDTYHVILFDIVENKDIGSQLRPLLGKKIESQRKEAALNVSSDDDDSSNAHIMPVGCKLNVFLSWVENPGNFWVQQQDAKDQLDIMTEQIQDVYSRPQPVAPSFPGAFIVARCLEDQMWYRGLVLKELEDDLVAVLYLDYGNSDILPKCELRQVKPEFGKIIPLATRCALSGVRPLRTGDLSWTNDAKDFLEKMTENGCNCEVVGETDSHRLVKLTVGSKDVSKELVALRVVSDVATSITASHGPFYTNKIHLEKLQKETVTVSHVESPKSFWCLLNKFSGALNDLMDKLSMHYSDEGGTPIREPAVGQACIVKSREDRAWYRAAVVKTLPTGYEVHLVDYGSNEVLPFNIVCQPEPRFLDLPMQAIHCSLPTRSGHDNIDAFFDLVLNKDLELEVIDFVKDVAVIELYNGSKKVSELLKASSSNQEQNRKQPSSSMQNLVLAPAKTPVLNSPIKVFISWVVSPSKFFLQQNGVDEALESLMDTIGKKYDNNSKVEPLSKLQVGQPCVGLYSADNLWYRGQIISVNANQCKVLFVDYGNEEIIGVENVRAILPEIASVPVMAIQCSLSGIEETTWSTSAIEFFETLVMDQEMECVFVTPTVVKLKNSGQDIVSQLVSEGFCKSSTVDMSATQKKPSNESSPWTSPIKQEGGSSRFGGKDGGGKRFNNNSKGETDNYGGGQGEKGREFCSRGFSGTPRGDSLGMSEGRSSGRFGGQHEDKRNGGGNRNERDMGFGGHEKPSGVRRGDGDFASSGGKEKKPSSDSGSSSSGISGELTYPDPPVDTEKALLTHMDDNGTFYIQLLSMEKDILFLSRRMAGSYKNGGGPRLKETPVKGTVCCAKFPLDGAMYRCVVEDIQGANVVLRYVDYGNVSESSARDLKMLFADLLQFPVLAFPCKLRGLNWSVQQAEKFAKATLDKELMVTFKTNKVLPYEVDVKTPEGDLLGLLTGKIEPPAGNISSPKASSAVREATSPKKGGFGEKKPVVKSPGHGGFGASASIKPSGTLSSDFGKSIPSAPKQEFLPQVPPVGENQAYITHLDQDGYFYLQLEKDSVLLEGFSEAMGAKSNLKHPNISVGAACAAVFSEDSLWYRAHICAVADATVQVKFVDNGNGDFVSPSLIAPLSSQLLASAPLAYQCQFLGLGPLSIEAGAKLSESYMEHPLTVVFSGKSAPYNVKITTSDGLDLQEILCPSNNYRPKKIPQEVILASVCHIEDNGCFYLQLFKDYKDIAELQTSLSTFCNTEPVKSVEKPETGLPCIAKDSDGVWHRSQILQIEDTSATIHLVDTGKSTLVELSSLITLDSQFLKLPPFALECCLNDVADRWNESLRAKFTDMTQGKVLNATFHTTTPPYRVSLTRSIELDLLDLAAPIQDSPINTAPIPDRTLKSAPISDSPANITPIPDNPLKTESIPDNPVKIAHISESPATTTSGINVSTILTSNLGADSGLSDQTEVYISHVEADGTFYIQIVAMEDSLNELADKLERMEVTTLSQVSIGDTVCAKFTEDDVWYRATVESCDPGGHYTVRFVDFGNTDVVGADRLAALSSDLSTSSIPPFTTRCQQTNIPRSIVATATEKIMELVKDEVVSVTFESKVSDVQEVAVTIGGKSLVELLDLNVAETQSEVNKVHVTSDVSESPQNNINTNNSADPDGITCQTISLLSNISAGQRLAVTIICAVSPDEFYLHFDKNKSGLDTLMDEMYDYFSNIPEDQGLVENLSTGDMCAALYEDESWYRVRIIENLNGTYQVFYIDHGNQEKTDVSSLRLLPDKFKLQAAYAIEAKLGGVIPVGDVWSDEAVEYFQNFVEEKSLLADIVELNTDNSSCKVHLLKLGLPVHELLIEKGFAVLADSSLVDTAVQCHFSDANESTIAQSGDFSYLESTHLEDESTEQAVLCPGANSGLKIGYVSNTLEELKEVSVYVSHAVSPSLFWCQLSTSSDTLTQISQSMETAYSSPQDEDKVEGPLSSGDIVAVVSDDGQMYRSKVLSSIDLDNLSDQKVAVRYLDYGNESEVSRDKVYKIKEELCSYPAQAIQCCLDCIQPSEDGWLPEACSKFLELVEGQELLLKLVGREQDSTILVDLVSTDSDEPVSASLISTGLGVLVGSASVAGISSRSLRITKAADTTGVDTLEITQPIMESTVMPGEITQNIQQSYLFEDTENGHYRCLRLSLHTEYEVMVSNNELPNSFHVQLLELSSQLISLMADIAEHVSDSSHEPSSFTAEVGACCLVLVCGVWYRGEVLSLEADLWNVKSVDCGWEVKVSQDDLKALPARFLDLPAQAVPCYLVGIVSVEPQWCSDAIVFFQDCLKETTFCMNVLENANDGKYGVYLSDINQTGTQSINRAMVDLGYAEVVPGSNIDIQIEMEKTLDTDMLNDLEESFNEISILKCNAHNDDDGEAEQGVNLDSEATLGDTYEESELCKAIVKHSVRYQEESYGQPTSDKQYSSKASLCHPCSKSVDFDLASAVDRIDQMGCKDVYAEGGLSIVFEEYEDQSSMDRTDDNSSIERQNKNASVERKGDRTEKDDDPISVEKVDELNSQENVDDLNSQEDVDDLNNKEKVDDLNNKERVDDLNNKERVDDLNNKEKMDDLNSQEKVDDLNNKENVDDFCRKKVDDLNREEKVDDFTMEKKVDDFTAEEKVEYLNSQEKVHDFCRKEKVDDFNSEEKVDDFTREEKVTDLTSEKKMDDFTREEKVDNFNREDKVGDSTRENKVGNVISSKNVENITIVEVNDISVENVDKPAGVEKTNDLSGVEKVDDLACSEKVDDLIGGKKVDDTTTEQNLDGPAEVEPVFVQSEADVILEANINQRANRLTDNKTKSLYTWKNKEPLRSSADGDQSKEEVEYSVLQTSSQETVMSPNNAVAGRILENRFTHFSGVTNFSLVEFFDSRIGTADDMIVKPLAVTNICMKTMPQDVGVSENMDQETGEIETDKTQSKNDGESFNVNLDSSSYHLDTVGQQMREKSEKNQESSVVVDTTGESNLATALWQDDLIKKAGITNINITTLNELVSGNERDQEKLVFPDSGTNLRTSGDDNSRQNFYLKAASFLTNKCNEVITGLSEVARNVKLDLQIFSKFEIHHLSFLHEVIDELETIELDLDLAVEQINSILYEISGDWLPMGQASKSSAIIKTKLETITQNRSECLFRDGCEEKGVWTGDLSARCGKRTLNCHVNDGSAQSYVKIDGVKDFYKKQCNEVMEASNDDFLLALNDTYDMHTGTLVVEENLAKNYYSCSISDDEEKNNMKFADSCLNETGSTENDNTWGKIMKCECDKTCQAEDVTPVNMDLTEECDFLVWDDSGDKMNFQPRLARSFRLTTFYQPFPELDESGYEKSRYLHREFGVHGLVDHDRISQADSPHRQERLVNSNSSLPTGKQIYDKVKHHVKKKYSSEIVYSPDCGDTSTPLFGTSPKGLSAEHSSDNSDVFLDCSEPQKKGHSGCGPNDSTYLDKSVNSELNMRSRWPGQTFTYEIDLDYTEQSVNQPGTPDLVTAQGAEDDDRDCHQDIDERDQDGLEDIDSMSACSFNAIDKDNTNKDNTDSSSSDTTDTDLQTSNYDTSSLIFTESSWDASTFFSFHTTELEGTSIHTDSYMSEVLPIFESDASDTSESLHDTGDTLQSQLSHTRSTLASNVSDVSHLESEISNIGATLESDTSAVDSVVPPESSMSLELGAVALLPEGSPQNSSSTQDTSTSSYTTSSATYNESSSLDSVVNGHHGSIEIQENTNGVSLDETKSSVNTNTDSDTYDLRGVDIFEEDDASRLSYVSQVTRETDISDSSLSDLSVSNSAESESETPQVFHPTDSQAESLYPTDSKAEPLYPRNSKAEPLYPSDSQTEPLYPTDSQTESLHPRNSKAKPLYSSDSQAESLYPTYSKVESMDPTELQAELLFPIDSLVKPLYPTNSPTHIAHGYVNLNLLPEHAKDADNGEIECGSPKVIIDILKDGIVLEQDCVGTLSNTYIGQDSINTLSYEQVVVAEERKITNETADNLFEKQDLRPLHERKYIDDTVGSDPPSFHEDTFETNQEQILGEESKVKGEKKVTEEDIIDESSDVVDFYQMDHGVDIEGESGSTQEGKDNVKGDDNKEFLGDDDSEAVTNTVENND